VGATEDWVVAEAALRAGHWDEAASSYAALAAEDADPRAQEGLAQVGWWLDDAAVALGAREAAYRGFRSAGDDMGAVRSAAALGYDSILFGKGVAVGRGWLARAADLLDRRDDVPEAGWLAVRQAEVALNVDHDPTAALGAATRAADVGRVAGDATLVIVGRALAGLARVRLGDLDGGMPLLDAAAAAATAGDVDDLMWMGKILCWLINACHEARDLERAADWCARVEDICTERDLAPLFAVCRTQYASILMASGRAQEAESTLVDVLGRLEGSRRASRLDAVAQLGELRRRQGRLDEAEDLLRQAGHGLPATTSLARLHLDRGDAVRAWSTIAELLRVVPRQPVLERLDALAVAVAAGVAAGRPDEARQAADELRDAASRVATPSFRAHAHAAQARLAQGHDRVEHWQDAARDFRAAGLAFDEADARTELAAALRSCGDEPAAREQEVLVRVLTSITRAPDAGGDEHGLTPRQVEVIRLVAQGLSNVEIAERLQLSEHTVHRHVANIYSTLDLASRAAAAAYAVRQGLT
jgi:LuxR family transcriptional regulator, maltose regulon positive regulatory protein